MPKIQITLFGQIRSKHLTNFVSVSRQRNKMTTRVTGARPPPATFGGGLQAIPCIFSSSSFLNSKILISKVLNFFSL
jgi:hypothetical protein